MKKVLIFLIIPLFSISKLSSQNLIFNSNFEVPNICKEFSVRCSPSGWFFYIDQPRGYRGPGSYQIMGSASGVFHLNLTAAGPIEYPRDYWQTKLLCPLIKGNEYEIKISITSKNADPNINDIGFWFSNQFLFLKKDSILTPQDYIKFNDANVEKQKNGWFTLRKKILAKESGASFLIIGNFSPITNEILLKSRSRLGQIISIYIDDIEVNRVKGSPCVVDNLLLDSLLKETRRHSRNVQPIEEKQNLTPVDSGRIPLTSIVTKVSEVKIDTIVINKLLFKVNESRVNDTITLSALQSYFKDTSSILEIEVTGSADQSGSEQFNMQLSKLRALNVVGVLEKLFSIPKNMFRVIAIGESNKFNNVAENRRVLIRIIRKSVN